MRISDWSSDVCSSDLNTAVHYVDRYQEQMPLSIAEIWAFPTMLRIVCLELLVTAFSRLFPEIEPPFQIVETPDARSEEHTSELQSLMRISYAVFCLKKKTLNHQ